MPSDLPEILLYISDQHAAPVAGFMGDPLTPTPRLDAIAADAAVFTQAYTSCPLCVPARASLMTGRMPSSIGVFGNDDAFSSQHPTFAHALAARGYETVLCGRMHFIGEDQRHGFDRRIAPDFCPALWGDPSEKRGNLGDFGRTLYQKHCLEIIGVGDSPVLSYDDHIVASALAHLESPGERPQLLVVGTYGPHFPYVCPEELFARYRGKTGQTLRTPTADYPLTAVSGKMQYPTAGDLEDLRAVYYAMVERMDGQIGMVYDAFRQRLARCGKRGVFIYMSDHGDQIGEKHLFGKQTFFEHSAKIPLLVAVDGCAGRRIDTPVSIMDIGTTLCGLTGARPPPLGEGCDQSAAVAGGAAAARPVISEFFDRSGGGQVQIGRMIRENGYKFVSYSGLGEEDLLFDIAADPWERKNIIVDNPGLADYFRDILAGLAGDDAARLARKREQDANAAYLAAWGGLRKERNGEMWVPPPGCRRIADRFKHPEYRK